MKRLLRGTAIPQPCSLPALYTLLAEDRVRGVRSYSSWAQLCVPCRHRCGGRGRHLWVAGGHGELAAQLAYAM